MVENISEVGVRLLLWALAKSPAPLSIQSVAEVGIRSRTSLIKARKELLVLGLMTFSDGIVSLTEKARSWFVIQPDEADVIDALPNGTKKRRAQISFLRSFFESRIPETVKDGSIKLWLSLSNSTMEVVDAIDRASIARKPSAAYVTSILKKQEKQVIRPSWQIRDAV